MVTDTRSLPRSGPLFPKLKSMREAHRSTEFRRACRRLKLCGITLHSYRYSWAERARSCGYPERFAQEALGHQSKALAPFKVAGLEGRYDVRIRVHGGGPSGQADAVRHGISRALVEADPELRVPLKREGFLTRDARIVERKKAGLHKARKAPQFSKR